jgi:diacylglycerol O-acyltransferase / wax synthase
MSKMIPPLDLMFLLTESPNSPKHVGAVMTFKLPATGGARIVREIADAYRRAVPLPPFTYVSELSIRGMPRWKVAPSIDMNYHVSHIALPAGSDHERFLELICDLHETVLDRNRPGFRVHIIEGVPDNAFAIYLKIHHAIVDGKSAVMRIVAGMSETAAATRIVPFYAVDLASPKYRPPKNFLDKVTALQRQAQRQTVALKDLSVGVIKKGLGALFSAGASGSAPFSAPRTPMNAPIRTPRSFAMLSLSLAEMRAVGKTFGGTLNDVAAAVVDAGFHRYLARHDKRPARPLVAACPVSLREPGDTEATTKASMMLVPLGAPNASIRQRMEQTIAAIRSAKQEMRAMSTDAAMLYAISVFGLAEAAESTQLAAVTKPMANFVLSNVPGSATPLHLNGARLTGMYPISALGAGIGANVTLVSYADSMDFGFVANGLSMPHLQDLACETGKAFVEIKAAAATIEARARKATRGAKRTPVKRQVPIGPATTTAKRTRRGANAAAGR